MVPTWNYAVVHAYGRLETVEDPAWLLAHVSELTRQQEAPHEAPWATTDAPESYLAVDGAGHRRPQARHRPPRGQGQDEPELARPATARAGVVQGLAQRAQGDDAEIAALVGKLRQ